MDSICILHTLDVFRGFPRGSGAVLEVKDFHFLWFLLSENRTQLSLMNRDVLGPWTGAWGIWTKFQGLLFSEVHLQKIPLGILAPFSSCLKKIKYWASLHEFWNLFLKDFCTPCLFSAWSHKVLHLTRAVKEIAWNTKSELLKNLFLQEGGTAEILVRSLRLVVPIFFSTN